MWLQQWQLTAFIPFPPSGFAALVNDFVGTRMYQWSGCEGGLKKTGVYGGNRIDDRDVRWWDVQTDFKSFAQTGWMPYQRRTISAKMHLQVLWGWRNRPVICGLVVILSLQFGSDVPWCWSQLGHMNHGCIKPHTLDIQGILGVTSQIWHRNSWSYCFIIVYHSCASES